MNNFFEKIINLFSGKKKEFIYYFSLDSVVFNKNEQNNQEQLRIGLIKEIERDLSKKRKEIKHSDFLLDTKAYKTHYVFASDSIKTNKYLTPVMYELYAYKTLKKESIFTYPFERLIFKISNKEIQVLKFIVEC